jgi:hypothetical protein
MGPIAHTDGHDGRWLSLQLAPSITCAIATGDREIIAPGATTGGISDEMVRDLTLACIEQWFAPPRAPNPVHWLANNVQRGSISSSWR